MSIEHIKTQLQSKMAMAHGLDAKVKFDFGDDGNILVDTTESPAVITENSDADDNDLTLSCSINVFEGILNGSQDPNIAFMMGKLKVQGNMGLAMKLNAILED